MSNYSKKFYNTITGQIIIFVLFVAVLIAIFFSVVAGIASSEGISFNEQWAVIVDFFNNLSNTASANVAQILEMKI